MNAILDFLYLDIERVKSLLSQLSEGVVERVIERSSTSAEGKAGAKIFAIAELGGGVIREKAIEQEKSLRDYLYTLFEEAATDAGLFNTAGDLGKTTAWTGKKRDRLKGGQLLKITAPTRILDAQHLNDRLKAAVDLAAALAGVMITEDQAKMKDKDRDIAFRAVAESMVGGKQRVQQILSIGRLVDNFFGGQILLRQFPCGVANSRFNLVGILSKEVGLLQDDPAALYAKYGYGVTEWTVVSQVANVPREAALSADEAFDVDFMRDQQIDRSKFEEFVDRFMGLIQQIGFSTAARFPEVSVQPLAVYHSVNFQ